MLMAFDPADNLHYPPKKFTKSNGRRIPIVHEGAFWEWLGEWHRFIPESSTGYGYQAFLDQTNAEFRKMIGSILHMGKFTDPRNEAEAKAIVADPNYFNYAQELVAAAAGGRARLQGQDILDGAQDANGQLWMNLLNPKLYEPDAVTWETRNPLSAGRNGIRGTIRSWARNKAGHFAARLNEAQDEASSPINSVKSRPPDARSTHRAAPKGANWNGTT